MTSTRPSAHVPRRAQRGGGVAAQDRSGGPGDERAVRDGVKERAVDASHDGEPVAGAIGQRHGDGGERHGR